MGVLLTEGCDLYGTDESKAESYGWRRMNGTQEACLTTGGRFGGPCFTLVYNHNGWQWPIPKANVTTLWASRAGKYPLGTIQSNYGIMQLTNNTDRLLARVYLNSAQQIVILDANGVIQATSTKTLSANDWYVVQAKFVCHATTGSVEVWVNGVQYAIATNIDTLPSNGNQYVDLFTFGAVVNGVTQWIDDIAIWDDSGSDWNDWTSGKDLRIDTIRPNADTAQEDFTPINAGDQFAEVNDDPDHDIDGSYNASSNVGNKDRLELATFVDTPDTIYNVRTRVVAKKTNAGSSLLKVGVYSGITEDMSVGQGLSTDYLFFHHDNEINPDDSLPWEKADIDALQATYEHA